MLPFSHYENALPYGDFLTQLGAPADKERWDRARESLTLTEDQKALLAKFTRRTNVLVLAGAWCGDCAAQCPIFERFAEVAPVLKIRYLDRDANPDVVRAVLEEHHGKVLHTTLSPEAEENLQNALK